MGFAESGDKQDVVLDKPIVSGDYFLLCLLPQGGFEARTGDPKNPDAKLHVTLGMINAISVE